VKLIVDNLTKVARPIRLIIIGSSSIHTQRYIAALLQAANFNITIITNKFIDKFAQLPQHIINFSYFNLLAARQIKPIITASGAEIIHIHQANSYAWHGICALRGITPRPKVILTAWGSDVLLISQQNWVLLQILKYCLFKVDVITANSFNLSNQIQQLGASRKLSLHTLHFGIESLPTRQNLRAKAKIILSTRLHKKLYQVDTIILAVANLLNLGLIDKEYKLIIAGDGPETISLRQLVSNLNLMDKIQFVGMLNYAQLVEYYQRATVFVSVPQSDAVASSVLEAMAYGCIPVLSNLPANHELILNNINGVFSCEENDLAQAILSAVEKSTNIIEYQKIYEINYAVVQDKGIIWNNIQGFINLYQSAQHD
jgi:glycosyltransferase involved in cell wall biosynthesis